MQQFGASAFYTVVRWHKSGEVDIECISHNPIALAICVPKIIKFGGDLIKFWQKQFGTFFDHPVKFAEVGLHDDAKFDQAKCSGSSW